MSDERADRTDQDAPVAGVNVEGARVIAFPGAEQPGAEHHGLSDIAADDPIALDAATDGPGIEPDLLDPSFEAVAHAHQPMGVAEVQRLALRGVAVLAVRTFGLRMITFSGNVLLARLLVPKAFGLFAIVSFVVNLAAFLADMGIGPALIQRQKDLTEDDLRTAFTLSFFVDLIFTVALLLAAPWIVRIYHLDPRYALPVRVLSVTILLSTFATIPNITLERSLQFGKDSACDMIASLVYIITCVALAYSGLHVWAFVIASILSRVVNAALLNIFAFWRPRFGLSRASVKELLSFGLPYQGTGILIQFKDSFVPTFLAVVAGASAVGYINWAVGMAANPLFLLAIVTKVTFPAYSRLQNDRRALRNALEQSIKWVAATVFPVALMLMALAPQIVHYVYSPKWAPGLPAFYMMCIPIMLSSYSTVMVSALYGMGRAKQVLKLTVIWTIVGWGLSVPLTLKIGYNGWALAMLLTSTLSVLSVREVNRVIKISFVPTLVRIFASAALPALGVWVLAPHIVHDLTSLAFLGFAGGIGYLSLMVMGGDGREAQRLMKMVLKRA